MLFVPIFLVFLLFSEFQSTCPTSQTQCSTSSGIDFCCPHQKATCCGVNSTSCCPFGTVCDPIKGNCVIPDNRDRCMNCQKVVLFLNSSALQNCGKACATLPPPLSQLCDYIVSLPSVCDDLIYWLTAGDTPLEICSWVGLCNGGTCACGYCTNLRIDRCLSVPNHCPRNSTSLFSSRYRLHKNIEEREKSKDISQLNSINSNINNNGDSNFDEKLGVCINGRCTEQTIGCCLTCA
jgi:hypothetical protein